MSDAEAVPQVSGGAGADRPESPRPEAQPPGLRNPLAAVRGVGASALAVEALVLLLAIAPLAKLGGPHRVAAIWVCVVMAAVAGLLAGMLRRSWAWPGALSVPAVLLVGGSLHWALAALGILFALLWGYVLNVRRTVLRNRPG